uniref:Secreted protein n=1 Tax=Macrostomum lignano TaxID=282301 RepID=A0A1I8FCV6_9PLAT
MAPASAVMLSLDSKGLSDNTDANERTRQSNWFTKHRTCWNKTAKDMERCISDLLVVGNKALCAFCAVVERQTTGKRPQDGVERDGCRRQ